VRSTAVVWIVYIAVWLVWWVPIYFWLRSYTLLLYPFLLAAWLVLELASMTALVFGVLALVRRPTPGERTSVMVAIIGAGVFALISLPLLWWGPLLFGADLDALNAGIIS
jgi:hypothetical protein